MSQTENTLCVGKVLLHEEICPSTNEYIKLYLSKSKPIEGTTVFTDNQTHGKGQYGNTWQSEPNKNIACSTLLYPRFISASNQFYLSKIAAIAVLEALQQITSKEFTVKWPNDIYFGEKKIAGILIENQLQGSQVQQSIIGIGINVNQTAFIDLPQAISLQQITGKAFDLNKVLQLLLKHLDACYLHLRNRRFDVLDEKYYQNCLGYKKLRKYSANNEFFEATMLGVADDGKLILESENQILHYNFKEVEWLFD